MPPFCFNAITAKSTNSFAFSGNGIRTRVDVPLSCLIITSLASPQIGTTRSCTLFNFALMRANSLATGLESILYTLQLLLLLAIRIEYVPTPANMFVIISLSAIILETRILSVDNLGEKYVLATFTLNLHPYSLYSVITELSPARCSNLRILYSP